MLDSLPATIDCRLMLSRALLIINMFLLTNDESIWVTIVPLLVILLFKLIGGNIVRIYLNLIEKKQGGTANE